ncbi:MAG TPA: MFS transporter [Acidimicrobiales bacterium]|nr:MFS transporter [Acidimicrobiales bacterium]
MAEQAEDPTLPLAATGGDSRAPAGPAQPSTEPSTIRLFNSPAFFRLWTAQVVSSLGDWLGFVAVTAIAARIGGSSPEAAISLVLSARLVPGFFLGPLAGVLIDRWDRRRVMVACDIGRGLVLATIPFVEHLGVLVGASLLLEVMTLLWGPAKEASVPNLVRPEFLANANSLSLVASYGTFPIGSALFTVLAEVAKWLGHYHALHVLRVSQESIAIYVDVATFFCSAAIISTLTLSKDRSVVAPDEQQQRMSAAETMKQLREGWHFIGSNPRVKAVIFGLGTGLVGGGMVVPLGPIFSRLVGAGAAGFGAFVTALGFGVAIGIVTLSLTQRHLPHERVFVAALLAAGPCIMLGASVSTLLPAVLCVGGLGLCAGAVYIIGYTILQANVEDELRGRTFATLYTMTRLCLLAAFTLAPVLSRLLDSLSTRLVHGHVDFVGVTVEVPGVRLALWLGGIIILLAGTWAFGPLWHAGAEVEP